MVAAEREAVGMDETAAGKDRERGGTGAEIDAGSAQIGFIVGQTGQTGDIRRGDHGLDFEMAALNSQHQVAHRRHVGGDHMHIDAKTVTDHAARLADTGSGVQRIADRQRMQHGAAVAHRMTAGGGQNAGDVAVGDGAAVQFDVGDETFAVEAAAGQRHHRGFKLHAGHALGGIDGVTDDLLRLDQIDHRAGLHAARRRMGKAHDAHAVAAPAQHILRRLRL